MAKNQNVENKLKIAYNADGSATVKGAKSWAEASGAVRADVQAAKPYAESIKKAILQGAQKKGRSVLPESKKTPQDRIWERGSNAPQKNEFDGYRKQILDLQKKKTEVENAEIDWTSAADRQENARQQKELQGQIDRARDEMNYRANAGKIDSMDEGQKQDLEALAKADNGFLSWMNIWDDQKALKTLQNPEENEYAQRFGAEQRLMQSGIGKQQLQGLAETYQRDMNRQDAEQAMEESRQRVESGTGGTIAENVAAFGENLLGGITGTLETADQTLRRAMGKSIYSTADTNRPGYRLSQKAAAAREATSEQILGDDPTLLRKGANLLYKGGTSAIDNVLRGLAGGGTAGSLALAGMGSFQDSYRSAVERGAGDETALLYGSVTAALEVATEFLPTEHLLGGKSAKECESILKRAFVQAGLEIPGEEISLWGEIIADASIMGDKSENNILRSELIANGYSKEQADDEIMRRNLMQSAETAMTTLISSGISTVAQGKVDTGSERIEEIGGKAADKLNKILNTENSVVENAPLTEQQMAQKSVEDTAREMGKKVPKAAPEAKTQEQINLDRAIMETMGEKETGVSDSFVQNSEVETAEMPVETTPVGSAQQADIQNVPADDGQQDVIDGVKGTGAAEAGFSRKPTYNATLSEENSQADRADDARPMELPKEDVNGGKVSEVTGNVYGSKITPDDFASLMEEPTARGDFSYIPISNDRATELAKQSIERSGDWGKAYVDWAKAVAEGRAGAEMSARGAMLLNKAAQDGNKGRWLEILSDMQSLGTNTAQGLQAFRLIRTLSPPDKLEFAKMSAKKLTESMRLRTEITIDEALLNEYENAQTDAQRDEIVGRIQQNVADQIPSTFMDKFNALRYLNMLGNLKTNVRNITGNVGAGAAYRAKDTIAAGLERVAHALSGGKTELTKSVFVNADMKKAAAKDFTQFAGVVSDGGKFSLNGNAEGDFARGVMDKRTIFKTKPLEAARKATDWAMNNGDFGDEAFGRAAYARALAGYLQANGVKETDFSKIDQGLLNKARTYAVKQAQEATFHDNNKVSATLVKLQKGSGIIGQGILPFAKTPANVLVRAEEFSPLGFINSTVKSIQKAAGNTGLTEQNGLLGNFARAGQEITGADLIDSWAKSFTGAGLFVLGAWLMDNGVITGGPDEDEDKAAFDRLNGIQPYALMLGGGYNITIDFLSPVAMTLFMGAQAYKIWSEGGDFTYEKLEKVATSLSDTMIQMSMLQGVDNTLNDIKYADNNLGQFLINACVSYLTQGLTSTLGGQIERTFEKERMTTYVDKDSGVPVWMQKQLGKMSQKIPGWDYQQMAYIDARGDTQKNMEGAAGALYNFASPGYIDKKEIDAVSTELYRLNDSATFEGSIFPESPKTSFDYTGKDGTVHKDFNLSAEQADTLKRVTGQTGTKILSGMMQSKDYAALTDTQKAEAVKLAYQYAQAKGRGAALDDYPDMSGWMAGIEGKEERAILQKVAKDTLQSAVSDWAEALKNGWSTEGDAAEIDSAYQVYQSMSLDAKKNIEDKLTGDAAAYLEIRSGGVTTEKYMDVVTGVKALRPEPTYSSVRDIQVREEIAGNRRLSDREKDIVMKAYMPDYDPKSRQPQTTELKYDAIRDMGVSPKEYTDAYRIYLDASGNGKRRRTIRQYMEVFGYSRKVAEKLYDIYAGYDKPWEE